MADMVYSSGFSSSCIKNNGPAIHPPASHMRTGPMSSDRRCEWVYVGLCECIYQLAFISVEGADVSMDTRGDCFTVGVEARGLGWEWLRLVGSVFGTYCEGESGMDRV